MSGRKRLKRQRSWSLRKLANKCLRLGSSPTKYEAVREHVDGEDDSSSGSSRTEDNGLGYDGTADGGVGATKSNRSSRSSSTLSVEGGDTNNVYESKVSLLPACAKRHGKFKGKGRASENTSRPLWATYCGSSNSPECHEAVLHPKPAVETPFRTHSNDPQADLRCWLTTPNGFVDGKSCEGRSMEYLQDERFTYTHLLEALTSAIAEIRCHHEHLNGLAEYGRRSPYNLYFGRNVASKADQKYFTLKPHHFEGAPIDGLREDLVDAALEIDYLCSRIEQVRRSILEAKGRCAKQGNWSEIEALLRMGVVDEDWVQQNCKC